jgi:hypothetical protein
MARGGTCSRSTEGALIGLEERLRRTGWVVRQPNMDEEADQHESDHEELVKQQDQLLISAP